MADKKQFELKIIEPDGMFYEGKCEFLEFTSTEGDMGVYPNHIPMTVILVPAVMKIHVDGQMKKAAVLGGFVEVQKESLTVLAEDAHWPEEIDVKRAEAAKQRAQERLSKRENGTDMGRAEAALKRAIARLNTVK